MTQIVALGEAVETAGAITYWSLSGDIDLEQLREALAIEGVDERLYRGMGITRGEALVRGARACANARQLVRPMGKRGAWALVQEHVDGDNITHKHLLSGSMYEEEFCVERAPGVERTEALDALIDQIVVEAQRQLGIMTAVDISYWLVNVAKYLHAVSLRDRGGVYFMPRDVLDTWRRITRVLGEESAHKAFEIPAVKSEEAVDAILTAVRDTVKAKFSELEGYLAAGVSTKGLNSWERQMRETKEYVNHYVQLLGEALPDLTDRLENFTGALVLARQSLVDKEKAA